MPVLPKITPNTLRPLIGSPEAPVIVDMRTAEDFNEDPVLLPGATRHSHEDCDALVARLNGRNAVIVCHKGLKISQGSAAWLNAANTPAAYLEGGMVAWRSAGGPVIPAKVAKTPVWAMDETDTLDNTVLAWFVTRFLTPSARILRVPGASVDAVADRFGARPVWSSLATALSETSVSLPALHRLAAITGAGSQAPETAGLSAILAGTSPTTAQNTVIDALYRTLAGRHA